ncbi:hypothetical protein [Streptomyces antarcticus]|uniref:hypothetical protein n=1 Tax=Streptomyces antarcticus TaxID=2996458 RepID=UPI00226EE4FC|nr:MULTISPECIES: hypothetical protein [unclassified Streptomyces]MCY0947770.1 hypothetical protein [Streptomyces sp. H34-AA3]MCZ4088366.1 hypothetical protein [Streptomyces sp. H34-S5]
MSGKAVVPLWAAPLGSAAPGAGPRGVTGNPAAGADAAGPAGAPAHGDVLPEGTATPAPAAAPAAPR